MNTDNNLPLGITIGNEREKQLSLIVSYTPSHGVVFYDQSLHTLCGKHDLFQTDVMHSPVGPAPLFNQRRYMENMFPFSKDAMGEVLGRTVASRGEREQPFLGKFLG